MLAVFFFAVFAILGVTLWEGVLYNRCRIESSPPTSSAWPAVPSISRSCGHYKCGEYTCGSLYDAYDRGLLVG